MNPSWFEKYPDRFEQENTILVKNGFILDEQILKSERRVQFSGNAQFDGRKIIVQFPDGFPSFAPQIKDTSERQPLRRHHNPHTRHFCLFGFDAEGWSAALSVAEALIEVETLLTKYSGPANAEPTQDVVPEPFTTSIEYHNGAAILVPSGIVSLVSTSVAFSPANTFEMLFEKGESNDCQERVRGIVSSVRWNGVAVNIQPPYGVLRRTKSESGFLHCLSQCPTLTELPRIVGNCVRAIQSAKGKLKELWLGFIFPEQSEHREIARLTWLIGRVDVVSRKFIWVRTFPQTDAGRASRVPDYTRLNGKSAAFVGCGCLGSKIACSLASSGAGKFNLFDPDIFQPDNSVRHECGWEEFGLPKVTALHHRLLSLNPNLANRVQEFGFRVGCTLSVIDSEAIVSAVISTDLVIDTTGSHPTSRYLNEICYSKGVPVLYASVTNGAWGGEIVRCIPGITPCWLCWMTQYYNDKPSGAPAPKHGVFHAGCDQPSFTGTTFETGAVANTAAWSAVEILLRSEDWRKDFDAPYLRWNGRDKDGAPLLEWTKLPVQFRQNCTICGNNSSSGVSY